MHISYPIKDDVQNYFNCLEQVIPTSLLGTSIEYEVYYKILEDKCQENPILIDLENLDSILRAFGIVEGGQRGSNIRLKNVYNTIKDHITKYYTEITNIRGWRYKNKGRYSSKGNSK